jgi:3-oxoacyl-[acyl-carrier-protein] synthase-3
MKIEFYVPDNVVDSNFLQNAFPSFDKLKFEDKIGIKERRVSSSNQSSLELSIESCKKLFKGVEKSKIDFIIYCTQTPKHILPGNSSQLQYKLGLDLIPSFDYNLGCSGYVYGLAISKSLVNSGIAKNILLITSDTYSKYLNKLDKSNRSIFGDGASATIVDKELSSKIGEFVLGSDGSKFDNLIIKNGGGFNSYNHQAPLTEYGTDNFYTDNDLYMNGIEIFNWTIQLVPKLLTDTLKKNDLEIVDIDYFIFHQANSFMLNYLRNKLGIPENKFYNDLKDTGNTVSSTIPIALKKCFDKKVIGPNVNIMLVGFGVGLSWGATIIKL